MRKLLLPCAFLLLNFSIPVFADQQKSQPEVSQKENSAKEDKLKPGEIAARIGGVAGIAILSFAFFGYARDKVFERIDVGVIDVYPNPTGNNLTVKYNGSKKDETVLVVMGMDGKIFHKEKVSSGRGNCKLEISAWPVDNYYCYLKYANVKSKAKRFIKV